MVLRKITIDNSVRYIPINEQVQSISGGKPNTRKNNSVPRKQNKIISQNCKKFIKNVALCGFGKFLK